MPSKAHKKFFENENAYTSLIKEYIVSLENEQKREDLDIPPLSKEGLLKGHFNYLTSFQQIVHSAEDPQALYELVQEKIDETLFRRIDNFIVEDKTRTDRMFNAVCKASGFLHALEVHASPSFMWRFGNWVVKDFQQVLDSYFLETKDIAFAKSHLFRMTGNFLTRGVNLYVRETESKRCPEILNSPLPTQKETKPHRSTQACLLKKRPHHMYQ